LPRFFLAGKKWCFAGKKWAKKLAKIFGQKLFYIDNVPCHVPRVDLLLFFTFPFARVGRGKTYISRLKNRYWNLKIEKFLGKNLGKLKTPRNSCKTALFACHKKSWQKPWQIAETRNLRKSRFLGFQILEVWGNSFGKR
jgi:hypothetical protein